MLLLGRLEFALLPVLILPLGSALLHLLGHHLLLVGIHLDLLVQNVLVKVVPHLLEPAGLLLGERLTHHLQSSGLGLALG